MWRRWIFVLASTTAITGLCLATSVGCKRHADEATVDGVESVDQDIEASVDTESAAEESITYATPEGWTPVAVSGLQKAAFEVADGTLSAEINAMRLPGPVTKLLPNVNMWRKRVGLEATTQEELDTSLESIELVGQSAHYISFEGPGDAEQPKAMLAVLLSAADHAWFLKMVGDTELVRQERKNFELLVKSVEISGGGDAAR